MAFGGAVGRGEIGEAEFGMSDSERYRAFIRVDGCMLKLYLQNS